MTQEASIIVPGECPSCGEAGPCSCAGRGPTIRQLVVRLRQLGFWLEHRQRRTVGSPAVSTYVRRADHRQVDVQLWGDGGHRASHALICPIDPLRMVWMTTPTSFRTMAEMLAAIEHERTRSDHPHPPSWESHAGDEHHE